MNNFEEIEPISYKIHLNLDVNKINFQGIVEIDLNLLKDTNEILLNVDQLEIKKCLVSHSENPINSDFEINPEEKILKIELEKDFKGKTRVVIEYMGKYHSDLMGLYRSSYEDKGQTNYVVVTQFEEIFARRAFPCIDHPSKKAIFEVEFIIDEELTGISNTAIKEIKVVENGKKLVKFEKSPKMCTYLLFFGVGNFEIVENKTKKHHIRLITTPGKTKYGKLGLEMALNSLEYLEHYTSIKYPLKKCDVICVPDFQFGAMENWGAILFRETLLLVYPDKTSKMGIFNVGSVVAHEVSHFWFGNLVSPSDWKYIWLNESFASYFTYAIPDQYHPEWHSWDHFITQYYISSLERDCLINTFPVELLDESEVFITPAKVGIIYNKGAAVLRMLVGYLGEEKFKTGISHFMTKFQYDIADSKQYWNVFEKATGSPVKEFADSWIHQPGYPLISVERKENKLILTQKRFTIMPNNSDQTWFIPIKIHFFKADGSYESLSISFNKRSINLSIPKDLIGLKINMGQTGFYRVKYSEKLLGQIGSLLNKGELAPIERFGIENDLFYLVRRGDYEVNFYLEFIERHFIKEYEYLPLISLFSNLLYIHTLLEKKREKVEGIAMKIIDNYFSKQDYEPKSDENITISILKNFFLWIAFRFGSEKASNFAFEKFNARNKKDGLSPDIISSVYKIAMIKDKEAKKILLKRMTDPEVAQVEKRYIYDALGSLNEEKEILEALELTIEKIPPQTWFAVFYRLGQNVHALKCFWPWFKQNLDKIEKQSPFVLARAIAAIVPMAGLEYKNEIQAFFQTYAEKNEFHKDTIDMALEQLEANLKFKENNT